jgi:hypothetical protein
MSLTHHVLLLKVNVIAVNRKMCTLYTVQVTILVVVVLMYYTNG